MYNLICFITDSYHDLWDTTPAIIYTVYLKLIGYKYYEIPNVYVINHM